MALNVLNLNEQKAEVNVFGAPDFELNPLKMFLKKSFARNLEVCNNNPSFEKPLQFFHQNCESNWPTLVLL